MNDDELSAFIESCMVEAEAKQRRLNSEFRVGEYAKFWINQAAGTLQFQDEAGEVRVEARIVPIGSFSSNTRTWLWAWANDSVPEALRTKAAKLKELEGVTGLEAMSKGKLVADEDLVNEITAMAVHHLEAEGYYRVPTRHLFYCLALEAVSHASRPVA